MLRKLFSILTTLVIAVALLPVMTLVTSAVNGSDVIFEDIFDTGFDLAGNGYNGLSAAGIGEAVLADGHLEISTTNSSGGYLWLGKDLAASQRPNAGVIAVEIVFEFASFNQNYNVNYNFPALMTSDGQNVYVEGASTGKIGGTTLVTDKKYKLALFANFTPNTTASYTVDRYLIDLNGSSAPVLLNNFNGLGFASNFNNSASKDLGRINFALGGDGQVIKLYSIKAYNAGKPVAGASYSNEFASPEEIKIQHPTDKWRVAGFDNEKPYIKDGKAVLTFYDTNDGGFRPFTWDLGNKPLDSSDKMTFETEFSFEGTIARIARFATLSKHQFNIESPSWFRVEGGKLQLNHSGGWYDIATLQTGVNYKLQSDINFETHKQIVTLTNIDAGIVAGRMFVNFTNTAFSKGDLNYIVFSNEYQSALSNTSANPCVLKLDAVRFYETPAKDPDILVNDYYDNLPSGYKPAANDGYTISSQDVAVSNGRLKWSQSAFGNGGIKITLPEAVSAGKLISEFEFEFETPSTSTPLNVGSSAFGCLQNTDSLGFAQPQIVGNSSLIQVRLNNSSNVFSLVAGRKYKQLIVADLDAMTNDYYIVDLSDNSAYSMKNSQPFNGSFASSANKNISELFFLFENKDYYPQSLYIDNLKVYKAYGDLNLNNVSFVRESGAVGISLKVKNNVLETKNGSVIVVLKDNNKLVGIKIVPFENLAHTDGEITVNETLNVTGNEANLSGEVYVWNAADGAMPLIPKYTAVIQ